MNARGPAFKFVDRVPPKTHPITRKYRELEAAIFRLTADLRKDVIIPFCDKKNVKFMAGNGTWIFINDHNVILDESDIPVRILRLLNGFPVPGTEDLSLTTQCKDYTPKGFSLQGDTK